MMFKSDVNILMDAILKKVNTYWIHVPIKKYPVLTVVGKIIQVALDIINMGQVAVSFWMCSWCT